MRPIEFSNPKPLVVVALSCAFLACSFFQGTRGLFDSTEGRYCECAREMIVSGDYLHPTLDFRPHLSKPPLSYWAIALGLHLLGINEWGARAFLIPTFCITVLGLYKVGRWLWDEYTGALAALIYATLWGPAGAANTVNSDTLLAMWEVLAIAAFWQGYRNKDYKAFLMMWVFFAMAFLTKGPPSFVPVFSIVIFWIVGRHEKRTPISPLSLTGILLYLVIALPWYILLVIQYPGTLSYWINKEILARIFTSSFNRHPHWYEAFTVYWPFLIGGSGPWLWFLAGKFIKEHRDVGGWGPRTFTSVSNLSEPSCFLLIIFMVPLVIFSISKSRLPLYVLPVFTPISLAMARAFRKMEDEGRISVRSLVLLALLSMVLIILGKGFCAYLPHGRDMGKVARLIQRKLPKDSSFYVASNRPHYALKFYFGDKVTRISPDSIRFLLNKQARSKYILVPKGYLPKVTTSFKNLGFKPIVINLNNRYWALIKLADERNESQR